ncbi:hypothetical protein JNB91_15925 [Rhizobium wenxiniae]|uniref:hypothetical protein n=1 Tax=Rhizobium wenxiniae TaxID=1737357 RepID=UPI001C6F3680|nr:hypothetical protein [Rhizobium wenxiniae]MBW9089324.1 hypothetical protein [Rhizobium wenxiniae]
MSSPTVKEIYVALRSAAEGSRDLDIAIAELLGWERSAAFITDISTGAARTTPQWIPPGADEPGKVPHYTSNLDDAHKLAVDVASGDIVAMSWENGEATATIGNIRRFSSAPTPALALCVAAVITIAAAETK